MRKRSLHYANLQLGRFLEGDPTLRRILEETKYATGNKTGFNAFCTAIFFLLLLLLPVSLVERYLTLSGRSIFTLKVESKFKLFYLTLLKHE